MVNEGLLASDKPLSEVYDLALIDLDGVMYKGNESIKFAPENVNIARSNGMKTVFVTNNASRTPEAVAEKLAGFGVPTNASEVMTAAQIGVALLKQHIKPPAKVLCIGTNALEIALKDEGYEPVFSADDAPQAVIQGYDPDINWARLAECAYAVENGALFIATNMDMSLPQERGFAPGNGSLVRSVELASGVKALDDAKPSPAMYKSASARVNAKNPLVIGDRLETDLAGAVAAGYSGLLVLTGVSTLQDAISAVPEHRPKFIGKDLRALNEPHPAVKFDGEWAVIDYVTNGIKRHAAAKIQDGEIVYDSRTDPKDVNAWRVALVASWNAGSDDE
ncbi:MAG: HAD-IIA family hydrolase [Bifidobacteriaceae bacterium]|jgi:HAD superfamily hydrolase (TIGR01450 family)|nr:HAD-IIA family hydrolase [Bifidobacteriaceae bacterium]